MAFDAAGNYFIADTESDCIRRVDAVTNIITTVVNTTKKAGSTGDGGLAADASINTPWDVFVASGNHLFVTDTYGSTIRRVDGTSTIITGAAGVTFNPGYNGDAIPATSAWLFFPMGSW